MTETQERDGGGTEGVGVHRVWLDGRRVDAVELRFHSTPQGEWRLRGRLPAEDPFLRTYGVSLQLADGRTMHGRARLVVADAGWVELVGVEAPVGSAVDTG